MIDQLPDYPFGIPSEWLGRALMFFDMHGIEGNAEIFEYPDYAGLPSEIADNIYSDEVDYIQDNWELIVQLCK